MFFRLNKILIYYPNHPLCKELSRLLNFGDGGGDVSANFWEKIFENGCEVAVFENFYEIMNVEMLKIKYRNCFDTL